MLWCPEWLPGCLLACRHCSTQCRCSDGSKWLIIHCCMLQQRLQGLPSIVACDAAADSSLATAVLSSHQQHQQKQLCTACVSAGHMALPPGPSAGSAHGAEASVGHGTDLPVSAMGSLIALQPRSLRQCMALASPGQGDLKAHAGPSQRKITAPASATEDHIDIQASDRPGLPAAAARPHQYGPLIVAADSVHAGKPCMPKLQIHGRSRRVEFVGALFPDTETCQISPLMKLEVLHSCQRSWVRTSQRH